MKTLERLRSISEELAISSVDDPLREAEMIIESATSLNRHHLYYGNYHISDSQDHEIDSLLLRRKAGEPIQYLMGGVTFLGLEIKVGQGVFIPRPETELMVEWTIGYMDKRSLDKKTTILDLCTGSGCIALALARHLPKSTVAAVDISLSALKYAALNSMVNNISNVSLLAGDLFEPLRHNGFDLIISNPPYIRSSEIGSLQREIRLYEPLQALDGGKEGTDFYRRILQDAMNYLTPSGALIFELGFGQSEEVRAMALSAGFNNVYTVNDYAGIERMLIAEP